MDTSKIILSVVAGVCLIGGVAHFVSASAPRPPAAVVAEPEAISRSQQNDFVAGTSSSDAKVPEPTDAVATWKQLLAADPADRAGQLTGFLYGLCRAGKFEAALKFAKEAPADVRGGFLKIIFTCWAQSKPQDAVKALESVADPEFHSLALRAIADGWDPANSGDLAAYANVLPAGDDRDYALSLALDNWSLQDPAALGAWLNTLPRGAEFDYGVALMIAKSDGANRPPELAMKWVENIGDVELKQDLLAQVLQEWSQSDAAAARRYVAGAAWLDDSQRREIFEQVFAAR